MLVDENQCNVALGSALVEKKKKAGSASFFSGESSYTTKI